MERCFQRLDARKLTCLPLSFCGLCSGGGGRRKVTEADKKKSTYRGTIYIYIYIYISYLFIHISATPSVITS
jgi:hypothetical protein